MQKGEPAAELPRRILMTADTIGGVWTYAMELCRGLGRHGIKVALATMGDHMSPGQRRESVQVPGLEVFESGFKLEWMHEPWTNVKLAGEWLLRLERYIAPDIIHLNGFSHGALPFKSPKLVAAHSCVVSWWDAVKRTPVSNSWDRYRTEVEKGLRGADLVTAPSRFMLSSLYRNYGFTAPGVPIYNGRDPSFFRPAEKEPFVLSAGRLWDEAKNAAALIDISERLSWPLYMAGDNRCGPSRIILNKKVHFLGRLHVQDLASWLGRASIYALPALYEPFGLSVLEAAMSGCALVLGDIYSLRELWDGAAVFVNPYKRESIAQAIEALIKDPEKRAELSARAIKRAEAYRADNMVQGYLQAYSYLLTNSNSAGSGFKTRAHA